VLTTRHPKLPKYLWKLKVLLRIHADGLKKSNEMTKRNYLNEVIEEGSGSKHRRWPLGSERALENVQDETLTTFVTV
jgi:hypothetical protein